MRVDRPTLIYDGECGLCRDAVGMVARWDHDRRVRLTPLQDASRIAELRLALPALAAAMHLVLPDGRVLVGADAAAELLRLFPRTRWLTPVFAIPGVMSMARRLYASIARRRHCLVRGGGAD